VSENCPIHSNSQRNMTGKKYYGYKGAFHLIILKIVSSQNTLNFPSILSALLIFRHITPQSIRFCHINKNFQLIIARQHAMHAERDIVLPILSDRPSVRLSNAGTVSKRMDTSLHFLNILVFSSLTAVTKFQGTTLSGAFNTRGGKI